MDKLFVEIESYAKNNDVPIMDKQGIEFLKQLIIDNNCKTILEIGSAIGYSALQMASINKDMYIVTIEKDHKRYLEAIQNINKSNCVNRIAIYNDDALTFFEDFISDIKYDLLFIDAAKAQSQKFFEKYEPLLSDEGIIIVDNIDFHGFVTHPERIKNRNLKQLVRKIQRFKDWLLNNPNYITTYYSKGDGVLVSRRNND